MSPTVVHCAIIDLISEMRNKGPTGPTICKITTATEYMYESAPKIVRDIVSYFTSSPNNETYKDITYIASKNS